MTAPAMKTAPTIITIAIQVGNPLRQSQARAELQMIAMPPQATSFVTSPVDPPNPSDLETGAAAYSPKRHFAMAYQQQYTLSRDPLSTIHRPLAFDSDTITVGFSVFR